MVWRPSLSVKEFLTHRPPANFYWKNSQSSFQSELFQNIEEEKGNIENPHSALTEEHLKEQKQANQLWEEPFEILITSS